MAYQTLTHPRLALDRPAYRFTKHLVDISIALAVLIAGGVIVPVSRQGRWLSWLATNRRTFVRSEQG